jgi:hypothetical protein
MRLDLHQLDYSLVGYSHYRTLFDSSQLKNEKSTTMPKFGSTDTEKVLLFVLIPFGTTVRVSVRFNLTIHLSLLQVFASVQTDT